MTIRLPLLFLLLAGCSASTTQPGLWSELQSRCGRAYEGRMTVGTEPGDASLGSERLVMHVRNCSASEIRIPFHVGDDRSRTWVLTRTPGGLRLKHDHRHQDGSEDRVTQYGGDSAGEGKALRVDFPADAFTGTLLPAAATNVWTMEIAPGRTFAYALQRANRRFRVEFDLTREVAAPPDPSPSRSGGEGGPAKRGRMRGSRIEPRTTPSSALRAPSPPASLREKDLTARPL